jgi:hypothetical protein
MSHEPSYVRAESYLYALQSHPSYYFAVGRSANEQALWGLLGDQAWILRFDSNGELKIAERMDLTLFTVNDQLDDDQRVLSDITSRLRRDFGWSDHPISVKRFWLREQEAGIDDLSDILKEFRSDPEEYSTDAQLEMQESWDEWLISGMFVFWWNHDFDVEADGIVASS